MGVVCFGARQAYLKPPWKTLKPVRLSVQQERHFMQADGSLRVGDNGPVATG
jgi:hypothetical protein